MPDTDARRSRDRLLPLPEVEQLTSLKKSSIYGLMRRGDFPPAVQVTSRKVAWSEAAVSEWIDRRCSASAPPRSESAAR